MGLREWDPQDKYELQPTDLTTPFDKPLFQVVALRDFGPVLKGDKGGYVESKANLSHDGDCWVSGNAWVSGDARVSGNAQVSGDAWVFGDAWVSGNSWVDGNYWVDGDAWNHDNCPNCGEKL